MTELYTPNRFQRYQRQAESARRWMIGLTVAAALVCLGLCLAVTTRSALALQWAATGVWTLAGWAIMLLHALRYQPAKPEEAHMEGNLAGTAEERKGVLTLEKGIRAIPRSISVRNATLRQGNDTVTLHVDASLADLLPATAQPLLVYTVRSYVVAVAPLPERRGA